MKFFNSHKLLTLIFVIALFFRLYRLGEIPVGFHADEVRVGWNAYSIMKTGMDDRGNRFSLYYNTFGDYRPTGIFYLTIPSIFIFGNNEFAVRLPSALLGALTIFPLFFLVREVIRLAGRNSTRNYSETVTFGALALLTISPWHINVSRSTSEVAIAMFLVLLGMYFLLSFLNQKERKFLLASLVIFLASYFFYHSARILVPLFAVATIGYYWKSLAGNSRKIAILAIVILSVFTFLFSLDARARGRFSQVSIFNDLNVQHELSKMPYEEGPGKVFIARLFHNKLSVYARRFVEEYGRYFSSDFLISKEAKPARYKTVGVGVLTYVELVVLITGLVAIVQRKAPALPLLLLLVAPIPAALTTEDSPNLHRSFFMVIWILIIGGYGIFYLSNFKNWGKIFLKGVLSLLVLNFIFYLHMYYVHDKVHAPLYRNVGARDLAIKLEEIQKNYDKIILTNIPDDPYPWIAFFTNRDPLLFNKDAVKREKGDWGTENLYFTGLRCPSRDAFTKPDVEKLLVVDADGCYSESNLRGKQGITTERILRTDGTEVYVLWSNVVP